jgi:hypothetical protein
MALSRLARLALSSVSDSPPHERAEICSLVATALVDDCPDLAALAARTSSQFREATESESELLSQLHLA